MNLAGIDVGGGGIRVRLEVAASQAHAYEEDTTPLPRDRDLRVVAERVAVAVESAALPAPLNNPLAPDAGRSRAGALPESIHREIYATLRIPAEVLTPVKTWHRQDE